MRAKMRLFAVICILVRLLSSPNVASKEHVIRQYDHEVMASTVIKPLQGVLGKQSTAMPPS